MSLYGIGRTNFLVHVKRTQVLEKLKQNRSKYSEIFECAYKAYLERVEKWLENVVEEIRGQLELWQNNSTAAIADHEDLRLSCHLPKPENHLEDYDDAIALLEDATDEEIEMTTEQHAAFMCNKWDWMHSAKASMSAYTETASTL